MKFYKKIVESFIAITFLITSGYCISETANAYRTCETLQELTLQNKGGVCLKIAAGVINLCPQNA